ncbi:MAG: hypothetical protein ACXADB_00730 [Candidatus Hermodarchaeia archaeon]|jgi:hypothetical protein
MAQFRNQNRVTRMGVVERAVAGARNPAPVARPVVRRAVQVVFTRR